MSLLSGAGNTLPNDIVIYDFQMPTFSVAAGASASDNNFPLTGSTRSYVINSTKNKGSASFIAGAAQIINVLNASLSCFVTTNTSDTTTLEFQVSFDGGTTWTTAVTATTLTFAKQNKVASNFQSAVTSAQAAAISNNTLMFRVAVNDNTSPTTDILTITNVRVTAEIWIPT